MSIKYPINPSLGASVKAFPKTQYDKIKEIIDAINPTNLTVTQATSISTAVTLNGVNGIITTVSTTAAALTASTLRMAASSSCVAAAREAIDNATRWSSSSAVSARNVTREPATDLTVILIGDSVLAIYSP